MIRPRLSVRKLTVAVAVLLAAGVTALPGMGQAAQNPPGADVGAVGVPFKGTLPDGTVQGFLDAHTHVFSNVAFGGNVVCGKPFDPAGPQKALVDCPDHFPNGEFAWFENFTKTGSPVGTHDPVGYPTFKDWPAHNSLTHQQAYYKWIERAWRGGLRLMVNHLVSNRQLCDLYPIKNQPCDEMDSIRLQARLMNDLQNYIDAENGGPGRGWLRVARSQDEARKTIEDGKLAVMLGVETSEPFGCRQILGVAQCSKADIDRGLDEMHALGVRTMFVCHKYDNALCGVRFDGGAAGVAVNAANFLGTGQFWDARTCTTEYSDNTIAAGGTIPDALKPLVPLPVYPPAPHCNTRGLTDLGEHMVKGMMARGMMVEVDHMSVKAADRTLDLLEEVRYPGVISSHSWTDSKYFPRIYALGGMIAQYGHSAKQFYAGWQQGEAYRDQNNIAGYGFGIDVNGLGGLPAPRSDNAGNGVTYPFTSADGTVTLDRQRMGERTWDVNKDGMAHYGLMPDWIEDIRKVAGDEIVQDLVGGAESYLRTWRAAERFQAPLNLAKGATATASASEWSPWYDFRPHRAVDGDLGTRWASGWSDAQWFRIDLGDQRRISRVALRWEAAYAAAYRIEVSDDGQNWRTVATVDSGSGGLDVVSFAPTSTRHVKVQGVRRGTNYGYSLLEAGVY